jgi:DNA-binding response OmpR family regulator
MKTILIVEDEPSIRLILRHFLRSEYQVVEAASAAEAVDLARLNRPDLVLLDLNLQGHRDGLEVGRTLRSEADPALARVPIVLITGAVSEIDIAAAMAAGVDGYIQKPFSSLSLLESVRTHLAREE